MAVGVPSPGPVRELQPLGERSVCLVSFVCSALSMRLQGVRRLVQMMEAGPVLTMGMEMPLVPQETDDEDAGAVYLEMASDPTGEGLSPMRSPPLSDANGR